VADLNNMTLTNKQYAAFTTMANEVLYGGSAGSGKALCLKTPLRTEDGWKTMGDVHPGDRVYDENGKLCNVIAESPIDYDEDTYKITFDDHTELVAGARHQWSVIDRNCQKTIYNNLPEYKKYEFDWVAYNSNDYSQRKRKNRDKAPRTRIMTTEEMSKKVTLYGNTHHNLRIPVTKALEFSKKELPIDPWLFGYLLGDGDTSATGRMACHADDKAKLIKLIESLGHPLCNITDPIHIVISAKSGIQKIWRELELDKGKYIPRDYVESSIEQRREFISGMIDADGSVKADGRCVFTNTNKNGLKNLFFIKI